MSEPIKLLPEELNKITDIRKNYFNIQSAIGQIQLSRHNFETQLDALHEQEGEIMSEYKKTQDAEKDFIKGLQDKYGLGTLNINEGEFVPAPKAEKPAEAKKAESKPEAGGGPHGHDEKPKTEAKATSADTAKDEYAARMAKKGATLPKGFIKDAKANTGH